MNESINVEKSLRELGVNLIVKNAFHQFMKGTTTFKPGNKGIYKFGPDILISF